MSRPHVTDDIVDGLNFARACVLDQRVASHSRKDHSWDQRYVTALDAIDFIVAAHKGSANKIAKSLAKKSTPAQQGARGIKKTARSSR